MKKKFPWIVVGVLAIIIAWALWPLVTYGAVNVDVPEHQERGTHQSGDLIYHGLLWWLDRNGPGYSFSDLWNDWQSASQCFHGGPSR